MDDVTIRPATVDDLEAINAIYNHYVLTSTATYQIDPEPIEARRAWFAGHGDRYPVLVAVRHTEGSPDAEVIGWAGLSPFHPRAAYAGTVENSVYVRPEAHRRGIGAALLAELLRIARERGHHTVIALIDSEQTPSLALHDRLGFVRAGHLREVGRKFDRWLDVIYMQRSL